MGVRYSRDIFCRISRQNSLAHTRCSQRRTAPNARDGAHDFPTFDLGKHHHFAVVDNAEVCGFSRLVTQAPKKGKCRGDKIAMLNEGGADGEGLMAYVPQRGGGVKLHKVAVLKRRQQAMGRGRRKFRPSCGVCQPQALRFLG